MCVCGCEWVGGYECVSVVVGVCWRRWEQEVSGGDKMEGGSTGRDRWNGGHLWKNLTEYLIN